MHVPHPTPAHELGEHVPTTMNASVPKLILATRSPRRHQLLKELGVPFKILTPNVTELDGVSAPHLAPVDLAIENARLKANAVAQLPEAKSFWILGADTIVALHGAAYGKPATKSEARKFLRKFRGGSHEVITGGVLIDPSGHEKVFYDVSRVIFRDFDDSVVDRYIKAVDVLDKAGGYALQQHGDWLIERVEGSQANVIGLPVEVIGRMFKSAGLL